MSPSSTRTSATSRTGGAGFELRDATSPEDLATCRELFLEYQRGLGVSLCFQGFDAELAALPGDYAPPRGRLLLASEFDQIMGCIALRPLGPTICEMKRLFVRPEYRARGLGRILVEAIIEEARELGYTHMRLDTIADRMERAVALYRSIGFVEIPPYRNNPVDSATFMELDLLTPKQST